MKKKIGLIIQARPGSTRYLKKILAKIFGETLIEHIII